MAGFEIIVRPVILPDIRPARQPRIPTPTAAADQNMAVLSGGSAQMVDLTTSTSYSKSSSKQVEKRRKFDVERVHRKDGDKVDKSQYVDVERVRKIEYNDPAEPSQTVYATPPKRDNVDILQTGVTRASGSDS